MTEREAPQPSTKAPSPNGLDADLERPAAEEEGLAPNVDKTKTTQPSALAGSELMSAVAGDWVLVSYHLLKADSSIEVAVSEAKAYETRERWRLRADGTFLRIMPDNLTFSGQYSLSVADIPLVTAVLRDSSRFLLTASNVYASIPGLERPQEFFVGEIQDQRLVLFYMGKEIDPDRMPSQAHGFRKSWKGGWTW